MSSAEDRNVSRLFQNIGVRMFWFELATWVRNYMLSRYMGLGNSEEVFARLKQVPIEYIFVLRQIFGDAVADDYVELFNQYIDLIDALITALNPHWSEEEWRARLYENLRSTIDESTSFLTKDYARNIDIFSRIMDQAESTSNYFEDVLFNFTVENQ